MLAVYVSVNQGYVETLCFFNVATAITRRLQVENMRTLRNKSGEMLQKGIKMFFSRGQGKLFRTTGKWVREGLEYHLVSWSS